MDELRKEVDALRRTTNLSSADAGAAKAAADVGKITPASRSRRPQSPSMGDAAQSAAGSAANVDGEPRETSPATGSESPPQSSLRDDSSQIEGGHEQPLVRSRAVTDPVKTHDDEIEASRAPLLDHLMELRSRLVISMAALIVPSSSALSSPPIS